MIRSCCHKMTANLIATGQDVGVCNDDRRARLKSENQHETKKASLRQEEKQIYPWLRVSG
jgi:hypothetical protein